MDLSPHSFFFQPLSPDSQAFVYSLGPVVLEAGQPPALPTASQQQPLSPTSQELANLLPVEFWPQSPSPPVTPPASVALPLWRPWENPAAAVAPHGSQESFVLEEWQEEALQPLSPFSQAMLDAVTITPLPSPSAICPSFQPMSDDDFLIQEIERFSLVLHRLRLTSLDCCSSRCHRQVSISFTLLFQACLPSLQPGSLLRGPVR